eukprot:Gb_31646 [translate_table: standard]
MRLVQVEFTMENVSDEQDNKACNSLRKSPVTLMKSNPKFSLKYCQPMLILTTRFRLNGRTDRSYFKKCLPVISYEDVEEDILRIANGDTSPILSANPISELPGLPARSMLTSISTSRYFRDIPRDTYNMITSPIETILCLDGHQSMYSQLLCGLLHAMRSLQLEPSFPCVARSNWLSERALERNVQRHRKRDTRRRGLYRYKVGDVLRVMGFHNAAPEFHCAQKEHRLRKN